MGKTLRRYVLVEITGAFLAGVALFTFVLFVERVLDLVDLVIGRGVPGALVARLFASILPAFLEITLPMALLLGVVMAFARMSRDGELSALRAAGIDLRSLLTVPLAAGLLVGLATLFLAVGPRPWGHRTLRSTLVEISETRATAALRPKFFNRDFPGMVVYVDRIAPEDGSLEGVMLSDERDSRRRLTVFAETGRLRSEAARGRFVLTLSDGHAVEERPDQDRWEWTEFGSFDVVVDPERSFAAASTENRPARELAWADLLARRSARQAAGDPAVDESLEIHRKLALAAACLALALVAVPLGAGPVRSLRVRGIGLSLGVIFVYYLMMSAVETAVRGESAAPPIAIWVPNLVLVVAALWMLARVRNDRSPLPSPGWIGRRP